MISKRTGLFFPGTSDLTGYPTIGVSENEVIIANISSLNSWLGTDKWDVPGVNNGMMDRVSDDVYEASANDDVEASFSVNTSGFDSYAVTTASDAIVVGDFDVSDSFTVVMCSQIGFGFGSFSDIDSEAEETAWYFINGTGDNDKNLLLRYGSVQSEGTSTYAGPNTVDGQMNLVIVEVNPTLGTAKFRVNGVEFDAWDDDRIKDETPLNELRFGAFHAKGANEGVRPDTYLAEAMSFTGALSDSELATIESYIMGKYNIA